MAKRKPILYYVIAVGYTDRPNGLGRVMGVTSRGDNGLVFGIDTERDYVTRRRASDVSGRAFSSVDEVYAFEAEVARLTAKQRDLLARRQARVRLAGEAMRMASHAKTEAWRDERSAMVELNHMVRELLNPEAF